MRTTMPITPGIPVQHVQGRVTRQAHVAIPEGTYEDEHGREGFLGQASHLYRRHPPSSWSRIEGPLKPRAFSTDDLATPDQTDPRGRPLAMLWNYDVAIGLSRRALPMPYYFRNADGDEIHFHHRGRGRMETDYGTLAYEEGDYVVIPKGTIYRLHPEAPAPGTPGPLMLVVESRGPVGLPDRGLLGAHAPFDPGTVVIPQLPAEDAPPPPPTTRRGEWEVVVKRGGALTSLFYDFCPMDVVGWKGDLTVVKLNVRDFRPVMSDRLHLPPSVHYTFVGPGYAVCTFAPRPLEGDPEAMRVPWYHNNCDYDEFIFYHHGRFVSRAGIDVGMVTLHPAGLHHGPQPDAIRDQWKADRMDAYCVMLDVERPLAVADAVAAASRPEYETSWKPRPAGAGG